MKKQNLETVEDYLKSLPDDRRTAIEAVRKIILENLPDGYTEGFGYGMIGYVIPLARYPKTYNGQPLMLAALGSQKNYMSLYLMTVYGDKETEKWFVERYKQSGKKLDMGKSCVRFRTLDDLPLELIGETIAKLSVEQYIARYEKAKGK